MLKGKNECGSVKTVSKRTSVMAVLECLTSTTAKRDATAAKTTWPGPPVDPPPEFAEREPQRGHIGADVNSPLQWNARERVLSESMEDVLRESEKMIVASVELQHFLLSPKDTAICIVTLADNACDERGRKKFAVLETKKA